MERKPKAPEQDNTPAAAGADNLPEQTEAPPFEVDNQPRVLPPEEAVALEQEGKAALFEMGEEPPDQGFRGQGHFGPS